MGIIIDGKEYYGIIYKIENTINHHVYIGQTTVEEGFNGRYHGKGSGIERVYSVHNSRKNSGTYYNRHLLGAIEKYGFDAFVVDEVFDTALSFDELNDKEMFYIKQFDSCDNGYNKNQGGSYRPSENIPSGKDCSSSKRVCQINLSGKLIKIWDCVTGASRELGIAKGSIANACSGRTKTAGGFVWVYEKDYDPNKDYSRIPKIKDRDKGTSPVVLLDENNNILQEFYSVNNAGKELGISGQEVSKICTHKRKNPMFNLMFKSEYIEEQRLSVGESYEQAS